MLELHVHTRRPRHEAVADLRAALDRGGAWIVDYREFSNKSVCVNFECDGAKAVVAALRDVPGCVLAPVDDDERAGRGTLQITLLHDEPDEKTVIPAVPG